MKLNYFLQTWEVNASPNSGLPRHLRNIINLAKEFNVRFNAIKLGARLKRDMPVWLHLGIGDELRGISNRETGRCLRENHHITTVEQLQIIVQYGELTMNGTQKHYPKRHCCEGCAFIRQTHGCMHPHKCVEAARELYSALTPRWNPDTLENDDGLTLTRRRLDKNERRKDTRKYITFNPSITVKDNLGKSFRIFSDTESRYLDTASRPRTRQVPRRTVKVYTDGSCDRNGAKDARAGKKPTHMSRQEQLAKRSPINLWALGIVCFVVIGGGMSLSQSSAVVLLTVQLSGQWYLSC